MNSKWLDFVVGLTLLFLVQVPLQALMTAATASQMWDWFLVKSYGESPPYGVLYGVATVFSIMTFRVSDLRLAVAMQSQESGLVWRTIMNVVIVALVMLFCLGSAWCVKSVLGW